jgi:glycosyltransferase involved in cell wall biosynthesis
MQKDRVIFLSSKNPYSKKDWSGIPFFLYQALTKHYNVEYIALPSFKRAKLFGYYFNKIFFLIFRRKYVFDYGIVMAFLYGIVGSIRIRKSSAKFIFSPAGFTETAFLRTSIPIVSYGDSSFLQLVDYYPVLQSVCKISKQEIKLVEGLSLSHISLIVFSSQWASNFVMATYNFNSIVIPFGANLSNIKANTPKIIENKSCRLLFIGVDWNRKGGDVALNVHNELLINNIDSKLTIVGVDIPKNTPVYDNVLVYSHIDKDTENGRELMDDIFRSADFLILPTIADCTPVVISEAYSYGLPVLAKNTGGLSSMVFNDITGYLLESNDWRGYFNLIVELIRDESKYNDLSKNCLKHYNSTFNWESWARNLYQSCANLSQHS